MFCQVWSDNMTKTSEPKIGPVKGEDFTCVTFCPDLKKFQMETLDKDIIDLFTRRAYDVVASSRAVKVFLNGKRLPVGLCISVKSFFNAFHGMNNIYRFSIQNYTIFITCFFFIRIEKYRRPFTKCVCQLF